MEEGVHQWHTDAKEGTLQPMVAEGKDSSRPRLKGTAHNVI